MYMYLLGKAVVPPLPLPPLPNLSKNLTSLIQHNYSFDLFWSRVRDQTKYIMYNPWSLVWWGQRQSPLTHILKLVMETVNHDRRLINFLTPIIPMRAEGSDYNVDDDDDDGGGDDDFRAKQLKCKHSKKPASIKKCSFFGVKPPLYVCDCMTCIFVQLLVCKPWEMKVYGYSGPMGESP